VTFSEVRKAVAAIAIPLISGVATLLGYPDLPEEVSNALVTIFALISIATGAAVYFVPNKSLSS